MDSLFPQRILSPGTKSTALKLIYLMRQIVFVLFILDFSQEEKRKSNDSLPQSPRSDPRPSAVVTESTGVQRTTSSLLRNILKKRLRKPNDSYIKEVKQVRIRVKGENMKYLIQLKNRLEKIRMIPVTGSTQSSAVSEDEIWGEIPQPGLKMK